jgi:CubicO group peptidase (beta-lactamase class C family)
MKGSTVDAVKSAMDQMIKEFVAEERFMGSVLVSKNGKLLLKKGYGFANLEWKIPNSAKTRFQIGSVTKQFTAASILLLQDRGKLNIDDPVKKHLPDSPDSWDKIRIFHLLTHTAGLHNYNDTDVRDFFTPIRKLVCAPENVMELFSSKPLEFEPGEKIAYSNSGYVVLGRIIEKISGQSYAKFVQENIFEPLGMKDSGYDSQKEIIKYRASGYDTQNGKPFNADYMDVSVVYAAGALYSTVEDLLKWERGLFFGKLLSESSLQKMTTPFKDNFALGLCVTTENGRKVIKHKGKNPGFKSVLSYYPIDRMIIVVLSNNESGSACFEIARMAAAIARGGKIISPLQRKEVVVPPEILSTYAGEYKFDDGPILAMTPLSDKLMARTKIPGEQTAPVQDDYWISAESNSRFFSRERADVEIEFFRNDQEKVSHLILHQGHEALKAVRQ